MNVQLLMNFAQVPPEGVAPVWAELADEQRVAAVNILARLMAATAGAPLETSTAPEQENEDE
jgi:hypothetical protein